MRSALLSLEWVNKQIRSNESASARAVYMICAFFDPPSSFIGLCYVDVGERGFDCVYVLTVHVKDCVWLGAAKWRARAACAPFHGAVYIWCCYDALAMNWIAIGRIKRALCTCATANAPGTWCAPRWRRSVAFETLAHDAGSICCTWPHHCSLCNGIWVYTFSCNEIIILQYRLVFKIMYPQTISA